MATGRKTVVVGQVIDPVVWGNPLWDQSVQEFASDADRTAQFPVAQRRPGVVTWIDDLKLWQGWDGAAWVTLSQQKAVVSGVLIGAPYTGQPIKHLYQNIVVATNATGDFLLMVAADYAGGGVLHASVMPRSNLDLLFAVTAVGANLSVRVYNTTGAAVINQASLPISTDVAYF